MSGTDSKLLAEGMSEKRRQLLAQYLKRAGGGSAKGAGASAEAATAARSDAPQPVSFAQASLWLLDRVEGSSTQYHVPDAMRLRGALNRRALEEALITVVARHDGLRARFAEVEGEPMQLIASQMRVELPVVDLRNEGTAGKATDLPTLIEQEIAVPFDLSKGPLVRARLFQLGADEHVLLTICHHIVCDGWSIGVFNRELAALYEAFSRGLGSPLPPLPMQYGDHVRRQRQRLQAAEVERLLSYWRKQLAGAPPRLTLPTDKPRPQRTGTRAESRALQLSPELSASLRGLSQREGVTLFMTLLAGFQAVLARHSGQEDIVIGTPTAGRDHAATEGLVGYFINAIALRTDMSDNPTFRALLQRVRGTALDAYAHQELPFEKLVEKLQPERDRSHAPVFQVLFNLFNLEPLPASMGGLQLERVPAHEPGAKFDITLFASDATERIQLRAVYNADLFTGATIQRLLERYETFLGAAVNDPGRAIGQLEMLTEEDRRRRTVEDNRVRPKNPFVPFTLEEVEQSIPARFAKVAAHAAQHVAVRTRAHSWTYAELERRATLIAHHVREQQREEGGRVALLLDHDAPMIAAILGVLQAGRTYVPLDPNHPKDRQALIAADAGATLLLSDARNAARAAELGSGTTRWLNLDSLDWKKPADGRLPEVSPQATAYLLYTSGSTGAPKGVTQLHRNVLQHIRNYTNSLHLCRDDRMTLLASYGFDAAVMGIFGALLNGATLCPYNVGAENLDEMGRWLVEQEITIYHSTPTLYRHLTGTLRSGQKFPRLRLVVLGGEKVVPQDVEQFQKWFGPECQFINGYGPTECTIGLQYFADARTAVGTGAVPIGYPMADAQISLINRAGDPGQAFGEIVIQSAALAAGYWGRPDLTAAAFGESTNEAGLRSYRTGDLGRLLADGMIESMGRRDSQVKIRGFRIELGEIESVLRNLPAVEDCVVVTTGAAEGDQSMVAYVVTTRGATPDAEGLRGSLKSRLPEYMIPAQFVFLQALPLTPNGKIDRRALPAPAPVNPGAKAAFVAPRTDVERKLARIWESVLGITPVGVRDDFFAVGGHSLLGVRVLAQAEKEFGRRLPLSAIFDARTIEELAVRLQSDAGTIRWRSLVPVQPHGNRRPVFGVHLLHYLPLANYLSPDQPFYGLRYGMGDLGEAEPPETLEKLAAHYVAEMRRFQPEGPYALIGYCFAGVVAYEMARQLRAAGQQVAPLILLDSWLLSERRRLPVARIIRNVWKSGMKGVVRRAVARAQNRMNRILPPEYSPHEYQATIDARWRQTYVPGSYDGPIVLLNAEETDDFYRTKGTTSESWRKYVSGKIEEHTIPSGHLGMFKEPDVQVLADRLNQILALTTTTTRR